MVGIPQFTEVSVAGIVQLFARLSVGPSGKPNATERCTGIFDASIRQHKSKYSRGKHILNTFVFAKRVLVVRT